MSVPSLRAHLVVAALLCLAMASAPARASFPASASDPAPTPPTARAGSGVGAGPGDPVSDPASAPEPVGPVLETEFGQQALAAAKAAKREAYALQGEQRETRLLEVARTYGAVADAEHHGLRERAEAAFRAGEILRARGWHDEARDRFHQADGLGADCGDADVRLFGARARLELAHALRRSEGGPAALETYASLHGRYPEQHKTRSQALGWSVKLLVKEERLDDALALCQDLGPYLPDYGRETVRTVDRLVDGLLAANRALDAVSLAERLSAQAEASLADGDSMTPDLAGALGALRVKLAESGYRGDSPF